MYTAASQWNVASFLTFDENKFLQVSTTFPSHSHTQVGNLEDVSKIQTSTWNKSKKLGLSSSLSLFAKKFG